MDFHKSYEPITELQLTEKNKSECKQSIFGASLEKNVLYCTFISHPGSTNSCLINLYFFLFKPIFIQVCPIQLLLVLMETERRNKE